MDAQLLLRDTFELSASCFPSLHNTFGNTKRHAMYIPQSFFENARKVLAQADAASTWEFPASISPSIPITSEDSSSPPSTPAQEIIFRYRAGMAVLEGDELARSDISVDGVNTDDGSSTAFYSSVEGPEHPPDDALMTGITETEIKFPHGESSLGWSKPLVGHSPVVPGT